RVRPNASLVKTAGVCVPARVGSQRNLMQDAGYAHSFIAVSVHSRDHHRQSLADGRWLNGDDARQVTVMELPSEVVLIKRRENTVRKWYSRNHRKTHPGLRRRRQLSPVKPRILARGWKRAFHHPIDKRRLQRPQRIARGIGIRRHLATSLPPPIRIEPSRSAAMAHARKVIAPHIRRELNIAIGPRTD